MRKHFLMIFWAGMRKWVQVRDDGSQCQCKRPRSATDSSPDLFNKFFTSRSDVSPANNHFVEQISRKQLENVLLIYCWWNEWRRFDVRVGRRASQLGGSSFLVLNCHELMPLKLSLFLWRTLRIALLWELQEWLSVPVHLSTAQAHLYVSLNALDEFWIFLISSHFILETFATSAAPLHLARLHFDTR